MNEIKIYMNTILPLRWFSVRFFFFVCSFHVLYAQIVLICSHNLYAFDYNNKKNELFHLLWLIHLLWLYNIFYFSEKSHIFQDMAYAIEKLLSLLRSFLYTKKKACHCAVIHNLWIEAKQTKHASHTYTALKTAKFLPWKHSYTHILWIQLQISSPFSLVVGEKHQWWKVLEIWRVEKSRELMTIVYWHPLFYDKISSKITYDTV